ncbi:hypothetical protein [Sulfobacillus thermotolerans]|uniref:hypothetical protein n=1 Tax=Sulfobacillus thermotolerans TaxID=338644 RepID=UPI003367F342
MKTTIMGSYPKIPAGPGPSVRTAIQRFEKGQISPEQLYSTYESVVKRVVDLAADAQCDRTTDGQIRWYDLFDPVVRDLDNVYSAGLLRLFDNNFYVRHPVVTGRLQYQGGTLAAWSREAASLSRIPVTIVLPGLFTFLSMVEDKNYHNEETLLSDLVDVMRLTVRHLADTGIVEVQWDEPALARYADRWPTAFVQEAYQKLLALEGLVLDLAHLVHEEAVALEKAGARYIQIDEPALSTRPEELDLAIEAMAIVTEGLTAKTISHICYGDFDTILPGLFELPVDQLDLEAANQNYALLDLLARHPWPQNKELALGVVDVHTHRIESVDEVKAGIRRALEIVPLNNLLIDPDCGLKTRTWDEATEKLRVMAQAVQAVREEEGLE